MSVLVEVVNYMSRADISTMSALNAFIKIYLCKKIFYNNCISGAFTLALHASYAAVRANLHYNSAFIFTAARRHNLLTFRDELYDALGASICAGSAAYTF